MKRIMMFSLIIVALSLTGVVFFINSTQEAISGGTVAGYSGYLYSGQIHNHANQYGDDGTNTISANFNYMKSTTSPKMDFGALSIHSHMCTSYSSYVSAVNAATTTSFQAVVGQEWSTLSTSNHVGVYFGSALCTVTSGDVSGFYTWLKGTTALAVFNHPWDSGGSDMNNWAYNSAADKPGSSTGKLVAMEFKQGTGVSSGFDDYPEALYKGWHIGITVSDDNHDGTPGSKYTNKPRTGIWISSLTATNIKSAFTNLRFFASQDSSGYIDLKAGSYVMGQHVVAGTTYTIYCKLNPSLTYSEVKLFYETSSSPYYSSVSMSGSSGSYTVSRSIPSGGWVFARAKTSAGNYIVSSPLFA